MIKLGDVFVVYQEPSSSYLIKECASSVYQFLVCILFYNTAFVQSKYAGAVPC
jgi:hypothetical protein